MAPRNEDEELIERYLLGELTEQDQSRVQDRLLTDPDYFKLLLLLENELTDRYARGIVDDADLKKFESFFAAPERRRKLRFAKALNRYVSQAAEGGFSRSTGETKEVEPWWRSLRAFVREQNPLVTFSMAAAALLMAVGATWLFREYTRPKSETLQIRAEETSPEQQGGSGQPLENAQDQQAAQQLLAGGDATQSAGGGETRSEAISVVLTPSSEGDNNNINDVALPKDAEQIYLRLNAVGGRYRRYRAELRSTEGKRIWSSGNLKAQSGGKVSLSLSAKLLPDGDYIVLLSGETVGNDSSDGTATSGVRARGLPTGGLAANRAPGKRAHYKAGTYRFRVIKK